MANRRMISKSISVSKKLAQVSPFSALLFTWLIAHCDDGGNMVGDAFTIKGLVIPVRPETVADVEVALSEITGIGLIEIYKSAGEEYLHIINWEDHQTLRADRASWIYPKPGNQVATKRKPIGNHVAPKDKISKDKISNTHSPVNGGGKEINEIIGLFLDVNPMIQKQFGSPPQRRATERLLKKFGRDDLEEKIKALKLINAQKYWPKSTTPCQLEDNIGYYIAKKDELTTPQKENKNKAAIIK